MTSDPNNPDTDEATSPLTPLLLPGQVDIREVGLRDGLQLEDPVDFGAKLAMMQALVDAGLRRIEATAFVSPRAVPAMADCERVAAELCRWPHVAWSALVASPNGARRAVAAGLSNIEYVVSAADGHSLANAGRTSDVALEMVAEVAGIAHAAGGVCEVVIATAWDCPFDGPTPVGRTAEVAARAMDLGADRLCLGDTIGTTTPGRVVQLIAAVRQSCRDDGADAVGNSGSIELGVHFHDTRGTGQANVLAALLTGVTQVDASVGGLGGCPFAPGASGNIATEELVYLLSGSGVGTGVDLDLLVRAAEITREAVGHPLPSSLLRAGGRPVPLGRERVPEPP